MGMCNFTGSREPARSPAVLPPVSSNFHSESYQWQAVLQPTISYPRLTKMILVANGDLNLHDKTGPTPLMFAASTGHANSIRWLLR